MNDPEIARRIRAASPEGVASVCAFGQLIRDPLLSDLILLNVHPSLLPRWRGAAPVERAIMSQDGETGVSVMRITAALDSGPVALQERTAIRPEEDFGSLSARLTTIGGELLVRALDLRERGKLELREQDESEATYAEKIGSGERRLDPECGARELAAKIRALTPHIGAYLELEGGARLGVRSASAEGGELPVGKLRSDGGAVRLGCGEGVLRLRSVQPPSGRPMPAGAFLRGHALPARTR